MTLTLGLMLTGFIVMLMFTIILSPYDIMDKEIRLFKKQKGALHLQQWQMLPSDELIECADCRHMIKKEWANVIQVTHTGIFRCKTKNYYCNGCKPEYESVVFSDNNAKYYKKFEVTKEGKLIK